MELIDIAVYLLITLAAFFWHMLLVSSFSVNRIVSVVLSVPLGTLSVFAILYVLTNVLQRRK